MKYSIAFGVVALATVCAGQTGLADLPECARPCAATLPEGCGISVDCICKDEDWIRGISCCVTDACSPEDRAKTLQVAQKLCDTVQVTLPSSAACPGDAASGTSTGDSAMMTGSSTMAGSTTSRGAGAMSGSTMGSTPTTSAVVAAATGAGNTQRIAPGVCGVAAVFGLALL